MGRYIHVHGEVAYLLNIPFPLGKSVIYARALAGTIMGVAGETRKGFVDMSIRTCGESLDLNNILRKIAPKLAGAVAAIHKPLAQEYLKKTSKNLLKSLMKRSRGLKVRDKTDFLIFPIHANLVLPMRRAAVPD
ncbi:MAG: hypothetical protein QW424_03415 [Candidatus Bathyarchaeia archaeon]